MTVTIKLKVYIILVFYILLVVFKMAETGNVGILCFGNEKFNN